ncbi:MAG: shikimate kinase [Terriglobales bacterium]
MKTRPGSRPAAKRLARDQVRALRTVFLVGFMGAGKTTVGQALSRRLGLPFEDLDDRIQLREGKTIEQIFRESGEAEFRKAETVALRELLAELGSSVRVVALGGGAFVQPGKAALIKKAEVHSVFLDAPVEELLRRCQEAPNARPLRQNPKQFRELYEQRRRFYMKAAVRIETNGKDVDAIAAEVACSLGLE